MTTSSRRRIGIALLALACAAGAGLLACELMVRSAAQGRCFDALADVPEAPVALVLGCSPRMPDGRRNLYFARRIDAAVELFRAGKVRAVLVSGDNRTPEYDEPGAMKAALVEAGVPAERITCDFAGLRTLDSVVRAAEVFGQRRFVVVSQRFHAERAVYLAREHGIDAFGYCAQAVGGAAGLRTRAREVVARAAAVLDARVLGTEPRHLGSPVEIDTGEQTSGG